MKYTLLYIMSGCLLLFGCRQEESFLDNAGRARIGLGIDEEIGVVASRSALSDEESNALIENCKIRIFNDGKLVNRYGRWSEVPEDGILMPVGDKYSTLVVAGDSVPASFDSKYYKGTEDFVVAKGQTTTVNVDCNIANTLVNMVYSDELSKLLEEAKVTVSVEGGSLDFTLGESKTGYFMVPESKAELRCVFSGKTLAGKTFSYEDTIKSVKEATLYTVTYSHSEGEPVPGNYGGAFFELKVDETPLYTEEKTVKVYQRPVISAVNGSETIDFNSDMFLATGATISPVFTFSGSTPLKSVVVESELLTGLGLSSTSLDIIAEQQQFINKGLNVVITGDKKKVTLEFGDKLNSYFDSESSYSMKFTATDTYDEIQEGATAKTGEAVWNIIVSDANVASIDIPEDRRYEIWSDKAVFYGQNLEGKTPTETLFFRYREKDTDTWSENIPTIIDGVYYKTEQVKGLKPGTTYQYQMVEGTKVSNVISEVTTEYPIQLPNNGFESWSGDVPRYIFGEGESMFWDSGNHGSKKVSVNVTEQDSSIKNSGTYSAKLTSLFANKLGFGQFAAGNIFIGKYLETVMDGITGHGVLGLGRPFTSRPIALRGYVKYISGNVDKGGDKISNNTPDQGIIYMALTDDREPVYEYGGEKWSFIIRTKDNQFFSKDNGNVIAYGEKVWTESTIGEGMHEFIIYFDYDEKTDGKIRIPTRLLLVAAASRYGDYFQGSTSSRMWLDDIELIYEESELTK